MEEQTQDQASLVREIGLPIHAGKMWLKLLGVLSILQGILSAITIVGIVIAWLPIWLGVLLYQSATIIERAYLTGDKIALTTAMDKLRLYFTIQGILTLIGLIIGGIALSLGLTGAILDILR